MLKLYFMLVIIAFVTPVFADHVFSIKGSVYDHANLPISSVSIQIQNTAIGTQTDDSGHFSINNLKAGEYTLNITAVGYEQQLIKIIIDKSSVTGLVVRLKPASQNLKEVNIVGRQKTRENLLNLKRTAMPTTVISRRQIELMGSRRLDEVLKEQTGISIVNNIGGGARSVGVQMQGFGSEYIMVMIDGQPMVGRNSGSFDLSRISVSNIERIEIIKGASSCLFGSEAMGGVINIITRQESSQAQAQAAINYGSLHIADITLEGETPFDRNKGSVNISSNYYHTDGYNTNPAYIQSGTTAPPYNNYVIQGKAHYLLTNTSTLGISGRYGLRKSFMSKDFGIGVISGDTQDEKDLNLSATFDHHFQSGLRSMSRYYFTKYTADQNVAWQQNGSTASTDVFQQTLHRFEQQLAYAYHNTLKVTGGIGGSQELMNDASLIKVRSQQTGFAYVQGDWSITQKLGAVGGFRYDLTSSYGSKLNPSVGLQYQIIPQLMLKIGAGTGFKAPDFKNRYLVFYNPTANYLVIGNDVLRQTIEQLQQQGQISEVRPYLLSQLDRNLQAERSLSLNAGFTLQLSPNLRFEGSIFHHKLDDQINSIQVATGSGNRNIYTYQNLPEAVNKGVDFSIAISPMKDLEIGAGYQYLIAKDNSVLDSIRSGHYPYNQNIHDPETGNSYAPKPSDYWGIENRSRHMLNASAFYSYRPWATSVNLRLNYRGKYPFGDRNGNQFIDRYDTFVSGYILINAAIEKKLVKNHVSIRLTADNLFNYTDNLLPGQPGRVVLAGLAYRFYKD
jgi:outer membrane receptor for ferrienterochelin and colicins